MVITQTPFRISFFGGGTDYRSYFEQYGGAVLSTSIDKYCDLTVRHLPPFFDHRIKAAYATIEYAKNIDEIKHPSIKACMRYTGTNDLSIIYDADLPARSGLGSSSSFTVGLLNAIHGLKGEFVDAISLGKEAIHVEQDLIGESVGVQDQMAAAYGGFNIMEFSYNNILVRPVVLSSERRQLLNDHLFLVYTGLPRFASKIASEQIKVTPQKTAELKEMHQMVFEGERILSSNSDISDFGKLLNESWKMKRSLTAKISNSLIDSLYEKALRSGAIGGKLIGAGGGGYILLFASPDRQKKIIEELELIAVTFKFENLGSKIIFFRNEEKGW
ncbi:MAG: kinase [Prevotella sp.]|jgi:D-glycero-alpha-D-manno-heptose-7-phosphate kinase|nr:kinase [Prevotella sp.]